MKASFQLKPELNLSLEFAFEIDGQFKVEFIAAPIESLAVGDHDVSKKSYQVTASVASHAPLLQELQRRITAELSELAAQADVATSQAKQDAKKRQTQLNNDIDNVSRQLKAWQDSGISDQNAVLLMLVDVLRRELSRRSAGDRTRLSKGLETAVSALKSKREAFDQEKTMLSNARADAERQMKSDLGLLQHEYFDLLIRTAGRAAEKIAPVLPNDIRQRWKKAKVEYLEARADLLNAMYQISSQSLDNVLDPLRSQARQLATRERQNDAVDDALEVLRDLAAQTITAIGDFVVDVFRSVVDFSAYMLEKALDGVSEATQELHRLGNGVLTDALADLDITKLDLESKLGGAETFTFDALIQGTMQGKAFEFPLTIKFADFWALLEVLLPQ